MAIIYREVNPESFEEVRQLLITHEYSWRDSDPEGFIPKSEDERDTSTRFFMKALTKSELRECGICAFDGDKMVGSHLLENFKIEGRKACHIHGLWIDPNYRGQGIATKLKQMGEQWARDQGCLLMDSNVRVTNESMSSLNKKLGYEVIRHNFRKELY